jgi:hypothetical protein
MRVLIAVAALAAFAAGACYSPEVGDCQFQCGPAGTSCPAGTTCMSGFCRTATGGCPAVLDACQKDPPPAGCGPRIMLDGGAGCLVQCPNERPWEEARLECINVGWQLGILDSADRLADVPSSADTYWVGARRTSAVSPWQWLNGDEVANEAWTGGTPPVTGESCAAVGGSNRMLSNTPVCTDNQKFICTFPP